jgi:hypothetical protein
VRGEKGNVFNILRGKTSLEKIHIRNAGAGTKTDN